MAVSPGLELRALHGTEPLGFLAAVGVTAVLDRMVPGGATLSWTREVVPRPVVTGAVDVDEVVHKILEDRDQWKNSPALNLTDEVKFSPEDLRKFLRNCRVANDGGRSLALASALVAENSFAKDGRSKPTALHFTSGKQKFCKIARQHRDTLDEAGTREAIVGPWRNNWKSQTFRWDITADRLHAITPFKPEPKNNYIVRGTDWLGLMGLVAVPVFTGPGGLRTTGSSGGWKHETWSWPLWSSPCTLGAIGSLLAAVPDQFSPEAEAVLSCHGVFRKQESRISRTDPGGYGSFSPAEALELKPCGAVSARMG